MTQQLLDDSQVGTALQQVCGETMTQRVRRDTGREARAPGRCTQDPPRRHPVEAASPLRQEEWFGAALVRRGRLQEGRASARGGQTLCRQVALGEVGLESID